MKVGFNPLNSYTQALVKMVSGSGVKKIAQHLEHPLSTSTRLCKLDIRGTSRCTIWTLFNLKFLEGREKKTHENKTMPLELSSTNHQPGLDPTRLAAILDRSDRARLGMIKMYKMHRVKRRIPRKSLHSCFQVLNFSKLLVGNTNLSLGESFCEPVGNQRSRLIY